MAMAIFLAVLTSAAAQAHESRPLYIEIIDRGADIISLSWRVPPTVDAGNFPVVEIAACRPFASETNALETRPTAGRGVLRCPGGIDGKDLRVSYPAFNPAVSTLVRVNRTSGETQTILAGPKDSVIVLPDGETAAAVARDYFVLGISHIWSGFDHLLFVACLVLISGTLRRILITVTGFTIAHSVTLALSALDVVRVPIPPVEAVIALSIVFVATEIVRERRDTLTWRYPIAVSGSFGLLHGFGFASALGEIGLPQVEIPAALLFFNLGVEAGQVAFVLGLIAVVAIAGRVQRTWPSWTARAAAYPIGILAAYWTIERIAGFIA
jgi:hydrogenase/urease accessory protein HupE